GLEILTVGGLFRAGENLRLIFHRDIVRTCRSGNGNEQQDACANFHRAAPFSVKLAKYVETAFTSSSVRLRAMCPIRSLGSFLRVPCCQATSCEDRYWADCPTSGGKESPTPTPPGPWQATHSGTLRSHAPLNASVSPRPSAAAARPMGSNAGCGLSASIVVTVSASAELKAAAMGCMIGLSRSPESESASCFFMYPAGRPARRGNPAAAIPSPSAPWQVTHAMAAGLAPPWV